MSSNTESIIFTHVLFGAWGHAHEMKGIKSKVRSDVIDYFMWLNNFKMNVLFCATANKSECDPWLAIKLFY